MTFKTIHPVGRYVSADAIAAAILANKPLPASLPPPAIASPPPVTAVGE